MEVIPYHSKPDNVLISLSAEEFELLNPEYKENMREHLLLQRRWCAAIEETGITLYAGEAMSIDLLAERFKGSIFWDIGCSVGMWSIAALECGAKTVYGFDPLRENKVKEDPRFRRFVNKIDKEPSVDFITITTKELQPPSIIKIDVEGDELEVLKGAERTIKKYKPILVIEAHEILFSNEPDKRQVTGNKNKVIDLLKPWIGEPREVLDQNIKEMGVNYHLIYI